MTDQEKPDISNLIRLLGPGLGELLSGRQIELEHVELELGELELWIPVGGISRIPAPVAAAAKQMTPPVKRLPRPDDLISEKFLMEPDVFPAQIRRLLLVPPG